MNEESVPMGFDMATVVMLQRIYDLQMAILNEMNPEVADRIHDRHEAGRTFNPDIYMDAKEILGDDTENE